VRCTLSRPGPCRVGLRSESGNAERDSSRRRPKTEIPEMEQTESVAESVMKSKVEFTEGELGWRTRDAKVETLEKDLEDGWSNE
jgi:hypothetical protein